MTSTRRNRGHHQFALGDQTSVLRVVIPAIGVYGDIDHPGLRLITCGGLDNVSAKYEANLVVFADLSK